MQIGPNEILLGGGGGVAGMVVVQSSGGTATNGSGGGPGGGGGGYGSNADINDYCSPGSGGFLGGGGGGGGYMFNPGDGGNAGGGGGVGYYNYRQSYYYATPTTTTPALQRGWLWWRWGRNCSVRKASVMKILFKGIVLGNLIALNLIVFFAYRAVSGGSIF